MRRALTLAAALAVLSAASLDAHDLFLKLTDYFVKPGTTVSVTVLNGTFSTSENFITRDRLRDITLVIGGKRSAIDTSQWMSSKDEKSGTVTVATTQPGTYVLGASTKPRELRLPGKEFNAYLEDEGLSDMLATRRKDGTATDSTNERYHKHVKAIFQVGDTRTEDYATVLGYPAEIVPKSNPYALKVGDALVVQCLSDGKPVPGVVVLAGGRSPSGARLTPQHMRATSDGTAKIRISAPGIWYTKFILMEKTTREGLTHESRWATLTFAVK